MWVASHENSATDWFETRTEGGYFLLLGFRVLENDRTLYFLTSSASVSNHNCLTCLPYVRVGNFALIRQRPQHLPFQPNDCRGIEKFYQRMILFGTRQADNEFIRLQRGNLHDYRWQVYFQSFSANTCNLVLEVWTNGHIFALNGGYFVYYPSNNFANHGKKSVQTVNRSLHGMFSFQCSLVRFYEHENMSPLF